MIKECPVFPKLALNSQFLIFYKMVKTGEIVKIGPFNLNLVYQMFNEVKNIEL